MGVSYGPTPPEIWVASMGLVKAAKESIEDQGRLINGPYRYGKHILRCEEAKPSLSTKG